MLRLVGIACAVALTSCGPDAPARREPAPTVGPADNEPIVVDVHGRAAEVHCEVACEPLESELGRLFDRCRADPLRVPHLVGVGGAPLAVIGCCTETEAAYREACGFDGPLSACGSAWAARCASGGT